MGNALKYIAIVVVGGISLLCLLIAGTIVLMLYEMFGSAKIEYYRGKFLLTATVIVACRC